jgi:Protein of unknown function (DUF3016)
MAETVTPTTMRSALYVTSAIVVLIIGIGCTTQGATDGRSRAGTAVTVHAVTVQYVNPQHFTDFSIHGRDIRYSASVFTQEITEDLGRVMKSRFPGDRLTLRFTNIDLAGHGSTGPRSVRVVRTHRPARLSFDYLLQDQAGRAVASGSQTLVDTLPFGHAAYAVSSGRVPLESRMLQRWLRSLSVTR